MQNWETWQDKIVGWSRFLILPLEIEIVNEMEICQISANNDTL